MLEISECLNIVVVLWFVFFQLNWTIGTDWLLVWFFFLGCVFPLCCGGFFLYKKNWKFDLA